ncbi:MULTISPECIES: cysteine--1-D-myo-inosityl 2-amino-2-deoxy-alpha-D-glucopyranoside ligase [Mumia]|uniref:cysteine--1-D-myo-inosityl 2-amino-2-deoxy-alpha-D-glucopyranoside ligase n=1 Tax=Mumia TaxID=1546255 RepID=UPI00142400F5|nr:MULTISPECIES: cysteine--1-D-myo-inosityl 2-amino-2-deoxy-alpha-D-glucopyranoside ligase [unclassified Mumia]QMW64682.1 cysteine--1-D-myo-inosityl 2-amino-2-deoxy-alpha-D-glucopyranoside ligase [Mumia sp. ZJ1417]
MRAWTSPEVPDLSELGLGPGSAVQVHDTASGSPVLVDPQGRARMYVCGITPYDATHLGHAATYLTFDLLQRAWRDRGLEVVYTQNITDVDDPLLERATATGIEWTDLAEREIELFREDMSALRILAPDHYIGAVESIDLAIALIERLRDRGVTYEVEGDVYFSVHADASFGEVSGYDSETMLRLFSERGGDPDRPGKRDPLDCLLWQAERPGEPSWESPFGRGRPGWHVECSSIALETLGHDFDVQGGGTDLIFPHHEMSASEAQVATEQRFARAYVHQAMVAYAGEKMSKSLGNLVLVSRLRADGHDPMAIRLAVLGHHYRTGWEWADSEIVDAAKRLGRWREAFATGGSEAAPVVSAIRDALAHDLDAPRAIAAVDAWVDAALAVAGDGVPGAGRTVGAAVDALLGVV